MKTFRQFVTEMQAPMSSYIKYKKVGTTPSGTNVHHAIYGGNKVAEVRYHKDGTTSVKGHGKFKTKREAHRVVSDLLWAHGE